MIQGTIFSIEEFAIHDGPGIRTAVFFKGCPLRCVWCHNPEGISFEPQYLDKGSEKVLCGYRIGADELASVVMKNREFLEMNNGGVTVTGGEPLAQPEFLFEFLRRVKPLHTAIETSGYASPEVFREAVSLTDLVLFDLKMMNPEWHYKFTGVRNIQILENLSWLCSEKKSFILRLPVIPGINDNKTNMLNILAFMRHPRSLVRVEFLPYHKTAGAKYAMIGKKYNPPFDTDAQPQIHNVFQEYNIKTLIL